MKLVGHAERQACARLALMKDDMPYPSKLGEESIRLALTLDEFTVCGCDYYQILNSDLSTGGTIPSNEEVPVDTTYKLSEKNI